MNPLCVTLQTKPSALYFKDFFRFNPFQTYFDTFILAVLINAIIKTGKPLSLTVEGLYLLFRIARESSCKFHTTIELAQALGESLSLLISLSLGETLLLEPFDGKVYDLLPVFLPELWSCPSNHLCLGRVYGNIMLKNYRNRAYLH